MSPPDLDRTEHDGACHCGAVRFHVRLSEGLRSASRCTCSYCRMRGTAAVTTRHGDLQILAGKDKLTLYRFNTMTARHYFCSACGITVYHQRRSNPEELGVNAACLAGVSPFDFPALPVTDGVRHPSDHPDAPEIVGTLRFDPVR
nr:GFA family protein [Aureimonas sp. AU12]